MSYQGADGPDNEDRRQWARIALHAFGEETGQVDYNLSDPELVEEIAADLIANIFHLADSVGLEPDALVEHARIHHSAEVEEEDEDEDEPIPYAAVAVVHQGVRYDVDLAPADQAGPPWQFRS